MRLAGRQNVEYMVQWKVPPGANPDDYEPTWEAEDNLEGCEDALRDFRVEWTRQYEAALKVCPRPPAQFSLPRIAPSATLTAFTPQAAKEKKEPLPMLNLPYCHADPFPEEPTGIEGTDTSDLDRVELSKFLNCAMRALPPQCREALCAA